MFFFFVQKQPIFLAYGRDNADFILLNIYFPLIVINHQTVCIAKDVEFLFEKLSTVEVDRKVEIEPEVEKFAATSFHFHIQQVTRHRSH